MTRNTEAPFGDAQEEQRAQQQARAQKWVSERKEQAEKTEHHCDVCIGNVASMYRIRFPATTPVVFGIGEPVEFETGDEIELCGVHYVGSVEDRVEHEVLEERDLP